MKTRNQEIKEMRIDNMITNALDAMLGIITGGCVVLFVYIITLMF